MKKIFYLFFAVSSIHIFFVSNYFHVNAEEMPTELICKCNAKANRDYYSMKKLWVGKDDKPSNAFTTNLSKKDMIMRDKVFLNLQSNTPIVKSITPPTKYVPEQQITEFNGTVIHRTTEMVLIKWENPPKNKAWTAAINLRHKIAVVSEYYNGVTSFGVNVETLDCR